MFEAILLLAVFYGVCQLFKLIAGHTSADEWDKLSGPKKEWWE